MRGLGWQSGSQAKFRYLHYSKGFGRDPECESMQGDLKIKICDDLFRKFSEIERKYSYSESWWNRHVCSRGSFLLAGIIAAIKQVVGFPFAMLAGLFSILTVGTIQRVNEFASDYLALTNLVPIIYLTTLGIFQNRPIS
jgi:hypothetical protein